MVFVHNRIWVDVNEASSLRSLSFQNINANYNESSVIYIVLTKDLKLSNYYKL